MRLSASIHRACSTLLFFTLEICTMTYLTEHVHFKWVPCSSGPHINEQPLQDSIVKNVFITTHCYRANNELSFFAYQNLQNNKWYPWITKAHPQISNTRPWISHLNPQISNSYPCIDNVCPQISLIINFSWQINNLCTW